MPLHIPAYVQAAMPAPPAGLHLPLPQHHVPVPIPLPPAPVPAPIPAPPAAMPAPAPVPAPFPLDPPAVIAPQPVLPLARQPFNPDWPVHYMGKMDVVCSHCQALHWKCEKLVKSPQARPEFGMCCFQGKIKIPKLDDPPPELHHLLSRQDDVAKKFRDHIRTYNNALAMTSLGCQQDRAINNGGGPYVFKVQGRLCHQAGSLIPREGNAPVYAQLYIYDPHEALNYRMDNRANTALDRTTMQTLQDMLYRCHPAVQLYKQANELTRNMGLDQQCLIALRFETHTDRRRYNLPTDTSNEIAVILPGDGDQPTSARNIVLHRRGGGLCEINDLHPLYPSLHYVLLFPTGQLGWHPFIPYIQQKNPRNENAEEDQGDPRVGRDRVTQLEYFRYRLHSRQGESNHIFMGGKLFQEYAVDAWATTEQARLDFIKHNQSRIRAETYQGLADTLAVDPNADAENVGQRLFFLLPLLAALDA